MTMFDEPSDPGASEQPRGHESTEIAGGACDGQDCKPETACLEDDCCKDDNDCAAVDDACDGTACHSDHGADAASLASKASSTCCGSTVERCDGRHL